MSAAIVTKPGVYSVPADIYHRDDGVCPSWSLSSTGARKIVSTCPALYWHERNNPSPPSTAFRVGSAAHEYLLEGETWPQRHFVLPEDHNGRTKDGKALVAEAEAEGLRVITHEQFETVKAMREALLRDPLARAALENGQAERSLYWRDEEFGIWRRARPDWLPTVGRFIVDYKTTDDPNPDEIERDIKAYGYHLQADWYLAGNNALELIEAAIFIFLFQGKKPPHLVVPTVIRADDLVRGAIANHYAMGQFAHGLRTGQWLDYAKGEVLELGLPGWAANDFDKRHERGLFEVAYRMQRPLDAA